MSLRPALRSEIEERFTGIDSDVITDLWYADLCFVDRDTFAFVIDDVARVFAFLLRRTHPHIGHPDD